MLFAAAASAPALDHSSDPRHRGLARTGIEVHPDQLDQIADASA